LLSKTASVAILFVRLGSVGVEHDAFLIAAMMAGVVAGALLRESDEAARRSALLTDLGKENIHCLYPRKVTHAATATVNTTKPAISVTVWSMRDQPLLNRTSFITRTSSLKVAP
jgi:hypothetical protein